MNKKMTDKEKLLLLLNDLSKDISFEDIFFKYLFQNPMTLEELNCFMNRFNSQIVYPKIAETVRHNRIAKENAQYVYTYLKGDMYKTKEATIEALPLQVKHAEKVVKLLNE